MTTGCVIFAFDGDIAYGPQAVLAARLVKKHLNIPVTLITDRTTLDAIDVSVFDGLVVTSVDTDNTRVLDGKVVSFKNTNRSSAFDLSPYDRTLIIDSDFLVQSDCLKPYLDCDRDFMICEGMNDLIKRTPDALLLDPTSVPMLWATNIIFNKTPEVKALFDLVDHVRENWDYYGALYKFDVRRFRNDYAFSVACHTLGGFGIDKFYTALPSPLIFTDKDEILQIKDHTVSILVNGDTLVKATGQDIHYMNKFDLLDKLPQLTELAE